MVIRSPALDGGPRIVQTEHAVAVQALIAQPPVNALDDGVLHGLSRFHEAQLGASLIAPVIDDLSCQFWPIVQDDLGRRPTVTRSALEDTHDLSTWQRRIHLDCQHLTSEDIHDREAADPPTPRQRIERDIDGPLRVGLLKIRCASPSVSGHALGGSAAGPPDRLPGSAVRSVGG